MGWLIFASKCAACGTKTTDAVAAPPASGLGSKATICRKCFERFQAQAAQREAEATRKRLAAEAEAEATKKRLAAEAEAEATRKRLATEAEAEATRKGQKAAAEMEEAIMWNRLGVVERLILEGADINDELHRKYGRTPLAEAVYWNRLAITKCLLDAGANTEIRDAEGETPLMYATRLKHSAEASPTLPSIVALLQAHAGRAKDASDRLVSSDFGPKVTTKIEYWDFPTRGLYGEAKGIPRLADALPKILECLCYEPEGAIEAYGFYMKGQSQHFCGNLRTTCAALCEDDRLASADLTAKWDELCNTPGAEWTKWPPRKYPAGPVWKLFFQAHLGNRRKVLIKDRRLVIARLEADLFECVLEPLLPNVTELSGNALSTPLPASLPKYQGHPTGATQPEVVRFEAVRRTSPLHKALRSGDSLSVINVFGDLAYSSVRMSDEAHWKGDHGCTALHLAAAFRDPFAQSDLGFVDQLCEYGDVDARDNHGQTPLHHAAACCSISAGRQLLNHSADPDARDERGRTPLHLAAKKGNIHFVELLLSEYAEVNAKDGNGNTPLDEATGNGWNLVADLLRQRAGKQSESSLAATKALRLAVARGYSKAAEEAVLAGADKESKDEENGMTPLHWASYKGSLPIVEILLKHNANVHAKNCKGSPPLHLAAEKGHTQVVARLMKAGANPKECDSRGRTALVWAAQEGRAQVVAMLLRCSPDQDSKDKSLFTAVVSGHTGVVAALIRAGADLNAKDSDGRTPLDAARIARTFNKERNWGTEETLRLIEAPESRIVPRSDSFRPTVACWGCGRIYCIGENSVAIAPEKAFRETATAVMGAVPEIPDLVSESDLSNASVWEGAEPHWQIVEESLAKGTKRTWRCHECQALNGYTFAMPPTN